MAAPANLNLAALYPPERPWPRRRLYGFITLCFVAQLIFILVFGEHRVPTLKPSAFGTGIHLLADEWSMGQLAAFSELSDPSVFALPSLEGFSRAGWLTYKAPPDEFADQPQAAKWLELDSESLGRDLAAFLATNTVPPLRIGDEPMPELVGLQPRPSAELEFPKSELRIAGALARRKLLTAVELPSWPHTSVLTNSVVRLLVDPDGTPFSTALVSGSGSKDADNFALATAKRLRFKPDRAAGTVISGTANFAWHTAPPAAATNRIISPGLLP
jgi:hypothetical protein